MISTEEEEEVEGGDAALVATVSATLLDMVGAMAEGVMKEEIGGKEVGEGGGTSSTVWMAAALGVGVVVADVGVMRDGTSNMHVVLFRLPPPPRLLLPHQNQSARVFFNTLPMSLE